MRPVLSWLSPPGAHARLSVLIFHRVLPAPDPLFPDETDTRRFDQICSWVGAWFNVLPLDLALRQLGTAELPERALAITFDDGYADNHDVALPILRRHGLSATFFIATGFLDGGCMWNDIVIEAVRHSIDSYLDLTELEVAGLGRLRVGSAQEKRCAIDRILGALKYLPVSRRRDATALVARQAGVRAPRGLMMSSRQVLEMRRAGMQIGAHTVSHPILATLDRPSARDEIFQSKHFLEKLLSEAVTLFAYPNGKARTDFTAESSAIARELGFAAAVSTDPGVATSATDHFSIPRFTPWDRSRIRFGARLAANLRRTSPHGEGGSP